MKKQHSPKRTLTLNKKIIAKLNASSPARNAGKKDFQPATGAFCTFICSGGCPDLLC